MESVATELAKPFVERFINGAIAESRYICCFTRIAEEFEEERVGLETKQSTVGQLIQVATRRGDDIQHSALHWKEKADKLIQEDTKAKQKFGLCPHCIWRYRRGKELAKKTEQIKNLKGESVENVGLPAPLPDVERHSSQYYISFKSRELKYTELLDALKDDSIYITGLQGMGGTGKTTLAKEVGKQLKQSKQFVHVVDTTVSFTPDIKKIQDDIAGPLGLTLGDCNESDRSKKLWSRLTNGEKILLILDDVWADINFDEIGIPYSDKHKGCRVLVTTRNLGVCNKMGCGRTIQLEILPEEEAWDMFKRHAGLSDISPESLLDKGRKIANECKGLPVAIAVIGSNLKDRQHPEEWDVALKSLQKPLSMHGVDDDLVGIYKCLKFSYDYMKDEKAKGLFLLCSVFPEDEEISIETLTRLGIASGLFGEVNDKYDDARSQVVKAKIKLLESCLLLEAGERGVKMHDLVREVAQWIANKEIRTVNLSHKDQKSMVEREDNTKYLYLCEGKVVDVFSCRFGGSKLEILIAFLNMDEDRKCVEVPSLLFDNNVGLRALHLTHYKVNFGYLQLARSLPHSIQSLTNIRSLLIDGFDLGDISIWGNLQSLETLELVKCIINEFPSEITKLEKFRLLKLEDCEIRRNNPFEVINRCLSLEELYFNDSFNSFCQEITFPKLQRYHVYRRLGRSLLNKSLSKCVAFDGDGNVGFFSEATFKDCLQTTEVLRLARIKEQWRNLIPEIVPIDQGLNNLVELGLQRILQLQCLIDTTDSRVPNVLSKLVVLDLWDMENLRSLFKCNQNLCNLKSITLSKCPMLVSLFQLSTSQRLVQLEKLEIDNCERLENIIIDERREEESRGEIFDCDNDNKNRSSMFPKLKVINIHSCPRLDFIFSFLSAQGLPILETIRISSCDKLKYIFGQYVHLGSLKEMDLHDLPNFIDIFPECYQPQDGSKAQTQLDPTICKKRSWTHICCYGHKYRHKLRNTTSTKLQFVSKDQPQDCSITSESNSYCLHIWERAQCLSRQSQILCNIKEIQLRNVSKIKSVFILSIAPRMLLETLSIWNCDELKHIIVDTRDDSGGSKWGNVFPKLKELRVRNCEKLEYIFGHYAHDHQNDNGIDLHLPALKCVYLYNLPSLVAMCPRKYRTTFPPLTALGLDKCSQVAIKSIRDFIIHSVSRSLDNTTTKELSGNVEHFLALKWLRVCNSKVENVFFLNEINGQQMNLGLTDIELKDLPMMTYLFVGPKNSFALQNLILIKIVRCETLELMFSTSIVRCLPRLLNLIIEECKELKHIIEDDVENKKMSNFPKLQALAVVKCNKLKCVLPVSLCKKLPELKVLMIKEAEELEEIFGSEGDQKVEMSNLKMVAFVKLPSLYQAQGIQFQAVENRFVQNCQKLSLTSTPAQIDIEEICGYEIDYFLREGLASLFKQLLVDSKTQDTRNENPSAETTNDFMDGIEAQSSSEHEVTSSQCLKEAGDQSVQEGSTSERIVTTVLSTDSETRNKQPIQLVTSKNKTSSKEDGVGQAAIPSVSITTKDFNIEDSQETTETNDQVSLNDDASKKVNSIIEEHFPMVKDDEIRMSEPNVASQSPSIPSQGSPSQIMEDSSFSSLVTRELEQLVSKKHLAYENLSLLIDFLVKHPSVRLSDKSLSNRYKGHAYNCLAELLKFLQTHTVSDVLGSSHSEFVELLRDARCFAFDKEWLDGVERRALSPGLQVSQDALQKLLDSKRILTQQVEDHKHQLASSEAILESIIQQEAQVLEARAALGTPLGY